MSARSRFPLAQGPSSVLGSCRVETGDAATSMTLRFIVLEARFRILNRHHGPVRTRAGLSAQCRRAGLQGFAGSHRLLVRELPATAHDSDSPVSRGSEARWVLLGITHHARSRDTEPAPAATGSQTSESALERPPLSRVQPS